MVVMMQGTDVPVICVDGTAVNDQLTAPRGEPPGPGWGLGVPPAGRKRRLPPGSEKMVAALSVTIIILLIASAILANAVFGTRMVSALLSVERGDVFVRDPAPYGDNLTALVPVEIEILNIGDGKSGNISVWCAAFAQEQNNLLKADFNTSQLQRVGDTRTVNRMSERDKPGSIVRVRGELRLPPGSYDVRLRIYEDAGKRTLVSGSIEITVNETNVKIQSPYKPGGRSPGRSYAAASEGGLAPGFDGLLVVGAGTAAAGTVSAKNSLLRNVNMHRGPF
jgi:hypothetical protein